MKHTVYDTEVGKKFDGQDISYHIDCFALLCPELGWLKSADLLPGFDELAEEDRAIALTNLP